MNTIRVCRDVITELGPNEYFVFGSNLAGRHGKGAALFALRNFGAILGISYGMQGECFAIPTKDARLRPLTTKEINAFVKGFASFASKRSNQAKIFLLTEIGCGLAGYKPKDIAPLFKPWVADLPNVAFPASFVNFLI